MNKFLSGLLMSLFFISCSYNPNNELIIGQWKAVSWLADETPKNINIDAVHFVFDSLGNYTFQYPGNMEKGTYKIEKNMLFTKAEGQLEIMTRLEKITKDSIILSMQNGNTPERLTLIRAGLAENTTKKTEGYLQLTTNGTYRLKPGQRAQFKDYENASTGAYWQVLKPKDSAIIRIQNEEYISESNDPEIVGAGGTRIYTIEAMRSGKDSLVLFHGREWEPDSWSFSRYLIVVE
jgi:predicted secreted protein